MHNWIQKWLLTVKNLGYQWLKKPPKQYILDAKTTKA
jgi:hypothetical protein